MNEWIRGVDKIPLKLVMVIIGIQWGPLLTVAAEARNQVFGALSFQSKPALQFILRMYRASDTSSVVQPKKPNHKPVVGNMSRRS